MKRIVDTTHRPSLAWYASAVPHPFDREQIFKILSEIQSPTVTSYERLPDGTEIWRAEGAPPGTKLMVTSQELAESLGKPWRLIEETAYAVGKEVDLRIRKVKNGEVHFCKKSL